MEPLNSLNGHKKLLLYVKIVDAASLLIQKIVISKEVVLKCNM
jgi:hypothetical protein